MKLHITLPVTLSALATLLFAGAALAKGVAINPGQWEMTNTLQMSVLPQPQVRSTTECIKESELNPDDFNMDEDNPCEITDVVVDGNSASWSISCPSQDGLLMQGKWQFTSGGDTLEGSGSMSADAAGMKLDFKMDWKGKRIGDCP